MGYTSQVAGSIEITPPLSWAAIRGSRFLPDNAWNNGVDVCFELADTLDGLSSEAIAVVSSTEDSYKAYYLEEHLAEIAREILAAGSITGGFLIRKGEGQGDVERYSLGSDGTVLSEKAELRWPDGTT
jgi:hypothetical protein